MTTQIPQYQADILGAGYEQLTLNFPDDYDGKVTSSLMLRRPPRSTLDISLSAADVYNIQGQ